MALKGIWRVGTETPFTEYSGTQEEFDARVSRMKNAYNNGVKMAFSTDADYYVPGMTRGQVVINFLKTWKAAEIPAKEILKIMTTNGYKVSENLRETWPAEARIPGGHYRGEGRSSEGH